MGQATKSWSKTIDCVCWIISFVCMHVLSLSMLRADRSAHGFGYSPGHVATCDNTFLRLRPMTGFGSTRRRLGRCGKSTSWRIGSGSWTPLNALLPPTKPSSRIKARYLCARVQRLSEFLMKISGALGNNFCEADKLFALGFETSGRYG